MAANRAPGLLSRLLNGTNRYGEFTAPLRDDEIPRYPPFQKGLPAVHSHRLLVTQKQLLREVQVAADIEDELWEESFVPMIERYAAFVHLLPASEAHHHRGAGGLFRHGLETALYALRLSRKHLFDTGLPPKQIKFRKPRWSATIFVAGMCHDLGKPITDVRVRNYAGTEEWPAWTISLDQWLHDNRIDHYVLEWVPGRKGDHETVTDPMVFWQVVSPQFIEWLAAGGKDFMPRLQRALRTQDAESRVAILVAAGDRTSVEKDLQQSPISSSRSLGVPVERHIIEGMRHLVSTGAWKVNVPGARLWHLKSADDSGLYVIWTEESVQTLRDYFLHYMLNGVPHSPEGIADALIERNFAQTNQRPDGLAKRFWRIAPGVLNEYKRPKNAEKVATMPLVGGRPAEAIIDACRPVTLRALRLASPAVLFDYSEPPPPIDGFVEGEIEVEAERRALSLVVGVPARAAESPAGEVASSAGATRSTIKAAAEPKSPHDETANSSASHVPDADQPSHTETLPQTRAPSSSARPGDRAGTFEALSDSLAEFLLVRRPSDAIWRLDTGDWMIGYPEPLEQYVDPAEHVLEELKRYDLIAPHPKVRTRWVHDSGHRRGLVLTTAASRALDEHIKTTVNSQGGDENEKTAHVDEHAGAAHDAARRRSTPDTHASRAASGQTGEQRPSPAKRRVNRTARVLAITQPSIDAADCQPLLSGLDTRDSDQALIRRTVRAIYQTLIDHEIAQTKRHPNEFPPGAKSTDGWVLFDRDDVQALCNRRSVLVDLQNKPFSFSRLSALADKANGLMLHVQSEGFFFNTTRLALTEMGELSDDQ